MRATQHYDDLSPTQWATKLVNEAAGELQDAYEAAVNAGMVDPVVYLLDLADERLKANRDLRKVETKRRRYTLPKTGATVDIAAEPLAGVWRDYAPTPAVQKLVKVDDPERFLVIAVCRNDQSFVEVKKP